MIRGFARPVTLSIFCGLACGILSAAESNTVWLDVPFVKQAKEGCGAASILMVMQYWFKQQGRQTNESADVGEIHRELYTPEARGAYASAMENYFQRHRFRTFSFRGELIDLRQHLEKGRPLIVALKPGGTDGPVHYVVVAGLDTQKGFVLVNDPAQRKLLKQDWSSFEKQWSATGKWSLLALPQPADTE